MSYQPTILVTGFEPFLGLPKNPSWEAVKLLPDEMSGCKIVKEQLSVVWFSCVQELDSLLEKYRPRMVISVGQGYPYPPVLLERIGMNICNGPDNTDAIDLLDEPIFAGGPAAYFATYPYAAMHKRLKEEGIPVRYNFNAGQNQCNCVLYSALHLAATKYPGLTAGFIHVPMLPTEKHPNSMPLETTARAIHLCVEEAAKSLIYPVRTLEQCIEDL